METLIYFKGERLYNAIKCDLVSINNGIGSILFNEPPNSPYIQSLLGRSGPLACDIETDNGELVWKYNREVLFYPIEECYWDKDLGIVCKLSYRLVKDNKIDNLIEMLGDMKRVSEAYREELKNINSSGVLVSRLEEFLDRVDQDEEKLKDFGKLHMTTRKRLISDYGISHKYSKGKMRE